MSARIINTELVSREDTASAAVDAISKGGLVVVPTETVYGVAGLDEPETLELIYKAKHRDRGKPVPLLAAGAGDLESLGFCLTELELRLAEKFWPGPLTLILRRDGKEEGVRIPDHPLVQRIISGAGGLLRVTSANQSGEPPALDANMAFAALGNSVSLIIDDGHVSGGVPSTVVKCCNEGFDILREGAISHSSINKEMNG